MPIDQATDSLIVKLTRDEATVNQGFELLVESYSQRLYWHIRNILKNHEDTNDVVQNTFIKIYKGIHGFKAQSSLYTWLYRIATNEALTHLKKKQSTEPIDLAMLSQKKEAIYFDEAHAVHQLNQAIEKLPTKQKMVFHMRYFDEMPYQEIADITDTSIGALKASYHHAIKKLEAHLINNNHN